MRTLLYCTCLMLALTGCGEPPFRCEKCKSETKLKYMPYHNGKRMVHRWIPFTEWSCQDRVYHEKRRADYRKGTKQIVEERSESRY